MVGKKRNKRWKLIKIEEVRRFTSWLGLLSVLVAEASHPGVIQNIAGVIAVIGFSIAAMIMIFDSGTKPNENSLEHKSSFEPKTWRITLVLLGVLGVISIQPWFQTGTAIAGGDISPPFGTAWIGRIFLVHDWSGSNLGGINSQQTQLPWAAVSGFVHLVGGSGALAQRIWLSMLVAGIMVGMGALIRSFQMCPLAGIVAAVVYFLSPFTISNVGVNDVFLVAMALLPILPATLISYGNKRFKKWKLIVIFTISAPFLGFSYSNPPLAGMIGVLLVITPFIGGIRFGKEVRNRSLWGLFLAGPVLIAFSSYWIIPSLLALHGVATKTLSTVIAWAWTEGRSTLANAFWINTTWGWSFPLYYSYAIDFSRFPLNLVRSALPALAFFGLIMRYKDKKGKSYALKKLYGVLVLLSLLLIFISTGTRAPGNILFNILYKLPYGWLLREPGRFLMLVALGYALMIGILVEIIGFESIVTRTKRKTYSSSQYIVASLSVLLAVIIGFPIWTGIIIPNARLGFPSAHVKEPNYWKVFSQYMNGTTSPKGSLLVLPPDPFYQMPYSWYYGNDAFIANMLKRHVLVPSGQGYNSVSSNLLKTIKLESMSLLSHHWNEANNLMTAIGTPLVVVRGDIQAKKNKKIISPVALNTALGIDPSMQLVKQIGPLGIYKQKSITKTKNRFATINTTNPNLNFLSQIPNNIPLLSHAPIFGHASIFQLPGLAKWKKRKNTLSDNVNLPSGWLYRPVIFGSSSALSSVAVHVAQTRKLQTHIKPGHSLLKVRLGRSLITNGKFTHGSWGNVGNCNSLTGRSSLSTVRSHLSSTGPFGMSALTLQAFSGSACEVKALSWHKGPFLLNFWSRSNKGSLPRVCLWEEPAGKCIGKNPVYFSNSNWHSYSMLVNPTSGTKTILLFLYADSIFKGQVSKEQYADISIRKLPFGGRVAIFGKPTVPSIPVSLLMTKEGFSTRWIEPKYLSHVVVDGLRNGWVIGRSNFDIKKPVYRPAQQVIKFELFLSGFSFIIFLVVLGLEKRYSIKKDI